MIEIKVGVFQGHSRDELDHVFPEEYARWRSGDPDYAMPGGESRRALMQRGRAVLESIAQGDYGRVIVVSHGAILAAAFKSLLEIPAQRHPFMLENASISRLEIDGTVVRLHSLNEVGHLKEVGLAGGGDIWVQRGWQGPCPESSIDLPAEPQILKSGTGEAELSQHPIRANTSPDL